MSSSLCKQFVCILNPDLDDENPFYDGKHLSHLSDLLRNDFVGQSF